MGEAGPLAVGEAVGVGAGVLVKKIPNVGVGSTTGVTLKLNDKAETIILMMTNRPTKARIFSLRVGVR